MDRFLVKTYYCVGNKTKIFNQYCKDLSESLKLLNQWRYVSNCVRCDVIDEKDGQTVTSYYETDVKSG